MQPYGLKIAIFIFLLSGAKYFCSGVHYYIGIGIRISKKIDNFASWNDISVNQRITKILRLCLQLTTTTSQASVPSSV